ncbi:solute carrier organic anion transporter family member 4C1-like [Saccoglossus kowalevskii]|uniref:Solute carrier organic anion transporter family member 4C1-like n=1 Tax=Saccoglossus kowalevskii TaxID=10224 RepID=A0ABM0MID0_SACKO|nr:PREDICTED: solute carrier organic anion transporter family member 4C1-like [Saccoglossus kowalevskii]
MNALQHHRRLQLPRIRKKKKRRMMLRGAEEGYYPLCRRSSNVTEDCDDEWDSLSNFFYVFILAQICIGIGASPIYTVGYAWVDENTTHAKSGWYMGILNTMAVLGPSTGFIVGALTLTLFTELTVEEINSSDKYDNARTKYIKDERRSQAHADGSDVVAQQQGFGRTWRDFWPASKILFKNYPYMWINCARTTSTLVLSGCHIDSWRCTLLGGWTVKKTNYGVKGNLKLCIAISIATIVLSLSYFLRCPDQPIAGVFRSYDPTNTTRLSEVQLDHPCNAGCNCFRRVYVPVCSEINGLQYFDGCYAGCELTPDALPALHWPESKVLCVVIYSSLACILCGTKAFPSFSKYYKSSNNAFVALRVSQLIRIKRFLVEQS